MIQMDTFAAAAWIAACGMDTYTEDIRTAMTDSDGHTEYSRLPNVTPAVLVKRFTADMNGKQSAALYVAGYVCYRVWINGVRAVSGPLRSLPGKLYYDRISVNQYLHSGENVIAAAILPYNGTISRATPQRSGFLCRLDIDGKPTVVSDGSWYARLADWLGYGELQICSSLFSQEHITRQSLPSCWQTVTEADSVLSESALPTIAAFEENGFMPAEVITPSPLIVYAKRPTAIPEENPCPAHLIFRGKDDRQMRPIADNLRISFNASEKSGGRTDITADCFSLGEDNLLTFDFGHTRMVQPAFSVTDFVGEGRIEIYYSTKMCNGLPDSAAGFGKASQGFVDSVTPDTAHRNQTVKFDPLYPRGCRFVTVRLAGNASCRLFPQFRTVDYPWGQTTDKPQFRNELYGKLWDICADNIRSGTTDCFVDTCERENALWTLDACQTARAAYDTFGDTTMWKTCLELIADSIGEDGVPHSIAVSDIRHALFDQELSFVMSVADYLNITHDEEFACRRAGDIERFMRLMRDGISPEGLYSHPKRCWYWADWGIIDKRPYSLPINALLVMACDSCRQIALLGHSTSLSAAADEIKSRIFPNLSKFFDETEGAFLCHIEPQCVLPPYGDFLMQDSDMTAPYGFHANIFALAANVGTPQMRERAVSYLKKRLSETVDSTQKSLWRNFGPGWAGFFFDVLTQYGCLTEVKNLIVEKYLPIVNIGAPTIGEGFGASLYNTAHPWGSSLNSYLKKYASIL